MTSLRSKIPIISFFSGGGFLDLAFEQAGFEIAYSNEIDEDFAQFYREGMSSWSGEDREISHIGDLMGVTLNDVRHISEKGPFGIIGGPPCQDFTMRGKRAGFEGVRGTLTYHFYEKIMDLHPDFFVMENVPGLVRLKQTKDAFHSILDLYSEEYYITHTILNALHYGVPQNRERLFVIGINKSFFKQGNVATPENDWFEWPKPIFPNAQNLYDWGEPGFKEVNGKVLTPPKELCVSRLMVNGEKDRLPNALEYFNLKYPEKVAAIEEGDTYRPSFKRLHRNKYSPTACYGNNEVHLHPYENRRLSVREALRIQGVPDSYVLTTPGKLSKKFKMIGNGVPVGLAKVLADSIMNFLVEV